MIPFANSNIKYIKLGALSLLLACGLVFFISINKSPQASLGNVATHPISEPVKNIHNYQAEKYDKMFADGDFAELSKLLCDQESQFENLSDYWNLRGVTELQLFKYSESKIYLKKAITLCKENDHVPRFNLAQAYIATKEFKDSLEVLRPILDKEVHLSIDRQMALFSYRISELALAREGDERQPSEFADQLNGKWKYYFEIAKQLSRPDAHSLGVNELNIRENGNIDATCYDILKSSGLYP